MEALEGALLRWVHVLVGIMWIGLLYFFNFVNAEASKQANAAGEGVLTPQNAQTASPHVTDGSVSDASTGGSTISLTVVAGTEGLTVSADAKVAASVTAAKSLNAA